MKNFILLSHPRSGTSYFKGVLSSHPEVICYDEIFNNTNNTIRNLADIGIKNYTEDNYNSAYVFLENFVKNVKQYKNKSIIGFKLFPGQLPDEVTSELIKDWKILLLKRKNMGQAALSYEIAKRTGQWNKTNSESSFDPFEANINRMIKFIEYYNSELDKYQKELKDNGIKFMTLNYETLYTQSTLIEIETFLELKSNFENPYPFKDGKLNTIDRYKLISNINEVNSEFVQRGFGNLYSE